MSFKKVILSLVIIIVAIGGFITGLILLRQRQEIREKASVPGGEARVSIVPASGNFNVGDTIRASVYFNTANIPISGIAIRLTYPFSGSTPEVSVSSIEINPSLLSSGDWTCPTQNPSLEGQNVVIDVACGNTSASGYATNVDVLFFNLDLRVERVPSINPVVVRFDPVRSVIRRKSDNSDILLIPTSTGTYTIGTIVTTSPSPSPTVTITTTPTPTLRSSPTPTPRARVTATPSATPTLPSAGISVPTILGVGIGILAIVGAFLLAL